MKRTHPTPWKSKSISSFVAMAMLSSSVPTLFAQIELTPSGNTVNQAWSGFYVGSEPSPGDTSVATQQTFTGLGSANAITQQGTFYSSDSGYQLAPGYGGSFSITGVQNTQTTTDFLPFRSVLARGNPSLLLSGAESMVGDVLSAASLTWQSTSTSLGSITYSLDFTGMELGYLPAGTLLFAADMDRNNQAIDIEGPLSISTITPGVSGQYLDYIGQYADIGQPSPTYPTITFDASTGTYGVDANGAPGIFEQQFDTSVFLTTQNLTQLTFTSSNNYANLNPAHHVFLAAPVNPVPEPSGAMLIGITGTLALLRRRRAA